MKYDVIIVGSGFSGSICANYFANENKKVLVLEKRDHIAGNMYDEYDENGILIQKYGPHILRSNTRRIYDYLENFSEFWPYRHLVNGKINDDVNVPLPFNLNSLQIAFKEQYSSWEKILVDNFGHDVKVTKKQLEEVGLSELSDFISQNIFENYSKKQWKDFYKDLDMDAILSRVPLLYISKRDGYFAQKYQLMPTNGFTQMFDKMLESENIEVKLNADAKDYISIDGDQVMFDGEGFDGQVIYTGAIDELFDYKFGQLEYLSVNFEYNTYDYPIYQSVGTQNYPNEHLFTRESEFKYLSNQELDSDIKKTVVLRETSEIFELGKNERYYPIAKQSQQDLYAKYAEHASGVKNLHLLGRLAQYKYFDMDHVIEKTLDYIEEVFNVK